MPLIDYKCEKCNKEFFELVKNSEDKVTCPHCGSEKINRVYKGKFYGKGGSCSGGCSTCSGCH